MSDYVIMAKEPLESVVPNDVRQWLKEDYSEQHLADAFADVSNKNSWLMHDADEDWTVLEILDGWHKLYDELYAKIIEILSSENLIENPNKGTHYIVNPFMERYGYRDGGGWWIKEIDV